LFGVNEVLEGRGEKIQKDIENRKREINPNSPEYMEQMSKVFAQIQAPMQDQKELKESLKGKTHKDLENRSRFSNGSDEHGEQVFNQIAKKVSSDYHNFHHFSQKDQGDDFQQKTNSEIIQDVKNSPQN